MVLNKLHGCGNINWRNFFPNLDLSALQQTHVSSYMKTTKAHLYAGRGDCARDQGVRGSKSDRLPSSRVEGSSTIDRQAGRCGRGRLQQGGEGDRVSASGRRVSEERVSSPCGAQGSRASPSSTATTRDRRWAHAGDAHLRSSEARETPSFTCECDVHSVASRKSDAPDAARHSTMYADSVPDDCECIPDAHGSPAARNSARALAVNVFVHSSAVGSRRRVLRLGTSYYDV